MVKFWQSKKEVYEKYKDLFKEEFHGRSESDPVRIMLLGEFNAGKSSLANAILGNPVLPVDIFQTTATINRIMRGNEKGYSIVDHEGHVLHQDDNLDSLSNFNADCGSFGNIKWIEIRHPAIPEGVELIDTPGFNDPDPIRDKTFMSILPSVDIMLFICDANQALKGSELPYIRKYFLNSISRVRFVFNHADTLKSFTKLNIVQDLVIKQIKTMLEEAAAIFESHECNDLSRTIKRLRAEDFCYFTSAALCAGLLDEVNLDMGYTVKLKEDFAKLKDYISGLAETRQILFEEWKLSKYIELLVTRESEIDFSIEAIEKGSKDQDYLRKAVADRLTQQLSAAKTFRSAMADLPNKIEIDISLESNKFLQKFEATLNQFGDDYGPGYLADHYQKEMLGLVQRLNEGIQKRLQAELKISGDNLIKLDQSDTSLRTVALPSQARRQQEYAQNMAGSGAGALVGAALGFLFLGGIPGAGLGAMVGGQMSQGSGQAAAMKAQRAKLDRAYQDILREARELLNKVKREVGQSVRNATTQFETDWVNGTCSAQWQILELVSLASEEHGRALTQLSRQKKVVACAIREFQVSAASLRCEL